MSRAAAVKMRNFKIQESGRENTSFALKIALSGKNVSAYDTSEPVGKHIMRDILGFLNECAHRLINPELAIPIF